MSARTVYHLAMQRFLPLLALASALWGQQDASLVDLPEFGVTLSGTPAHPTLVNTSGKSLIGYVLRMEYASGQSGYGRTLNTRSLRLNVPALGLGGPASAGIPPGGTLRLEYPTPPIVTSFPSSQASTPPVRIRAALDALIFSDGQFVGPDEGHNFEVLAKQLIAEQELAQLFLLPAMILPNGRPSWQRLRA